MTIQLRRLVRLEYGNSLESAARIPGDIPAVGSGGASGNHDVANTDGPVIVVGRKGSYGSLHWFEKPVFCIDTAYFIDQSCCQTDLRFMYYLLQTLDLRSGSQDVGVPGLSRRTAYESRVVEPPSLAVQRQRSQYLDRECARIGELVSEQQSQVRWLRERYLARLADTLMAPETPAGWTDTRVKYLFEYERNGIWGEEPTGGSDDVKCVRVGDFDRFAFRAGASAQTLRSVPASQRLQRLLRPGDVLLEKAGGTQEKPVGCAVTYDGAGPSVCSNFVAQLRPTTAHNARYLGLLMAALYQTKRNGPFVKQTTGIQNLDSHDYLGQWVAIPSRGEQDRIVSLLEAALGTATRSLAEVQLQVGLLQEHKQALIAAVVTGQKEVA